MKTFVLPMLLAASVAHGAVVAEVVVIDAALRLHDEQGPCLGRAMLAVLHQGPLVTPGCWLLDGDTVTIAFLDGDYARVPAAAFRKPRLL